MELQHLQSTQRSDANGQQPEEPVRILLVDDRPENLLALEAILEDLNQTLVRATSGQEALRAVLEQDFAVILMDVQMPGMDGFETASLIREREDSKHVPIIFVTAIDRSDSHVFKAYDAGAVDYIFKPLDPHILKAKVRVFIDLFRKTQKIRQFNAYLEQCVEERTEALQDANRVLKKEVEERQRAEAEVRSLNASLEQRVRERTAELEAINAELVAFSYSVSHDLRAPLRKIEAFSSFILEDYTDQLDETGADYLHRINKASAHMSALIGDLLKLSRVTSGELVMTDINLSEMAVEIVRELQQTQPERALDVQIAPDITATGDARLLRLALQNLLENAWKFTVRESRPALAFGEAEQDGETVYFVRDNGAGFDMKFSDKLFSPFQRLHSQDEFPGTGIGLAIVQRVIRRHGGHIWSESSVDEGATFYFTLGTA